jgi:hypothetical protein
MLDTNGRPVVEYVRECEEQLYQRTVEQLGEAADIPDLLSGLYNQFSLAFELAESPQQENYLVPMTLIMSCQSLLITATLAAARGHLSDAYQATRRALESCVFARRMAMNPELADVWMEASESATAYKKYRKEFSSDNLWDDSDSMLTMLKLQHDFASKMMHSTVFSMAGHLKQLDSGMQFSYFEIDSVESDEEPMFTLVSVWASHFVMIRVFAMFLADIMKPVTNEWETGCKSVQSAFKSHAVQWLRNLSEG